MRYLVPGTVLNEIAGSTIRYPAWRVLVWDPSEVTLNEVVTNSAVVAPRELTPYVEQVGLSENVGFENFEDPSFPRAEFTFRNDPNLAMRRGLVEDGVIVRVFSGDMRVNKDDWVCMFTGTFRGRPGEDPGTPAEKTRGLVAVAYGREERFLNRQVTTRSFGRDVDLGVIALEIARTHMELLQDEVLFAAQGFPVRHDVSQLVELPALQALADCFFPVGKKPKFDSLGRLVACDARLDKPAVRIFGEMATVRSRKAEPNEVEVNNVVILRGLSHVLSKIVQDTQRLTEVQATTGWFERDFDEDVYYSQDRTRRAQNTYLVTIKRIRWADAEWTEIDEFHGKLEIDTRWLANVQGILFGTFLATRIALAAIDYAVQQSAGAAGTVLAIVRLGLELASMASLVGFLWATSQIARGKYEIWGDPFEFVYQELVARDLIDGLRPEEERVVEYRNDFISDIETLKRRAKEQLKRELVKDQLWVIEVADDFLIEVDDIIELADGNRYYVVSCERTYQRGVVPILTLTCWHVFDPKTAVIDAADLTEVSA